jgi:hypothetical protein
MSRSQIQLPIISILNATSDSSRSINTTQETDDATSVLILCPATLPETVTILVSADGGTTYPYTLQNGNGSDITLAAGKAIPITVPMGMLWRLHSGVAVAAQRDFNIVKEIFISGHV